MEAESKKQKIILASEEEKIIQNVQTIEFKPQSLPKIVEEQINSLKDFENKKKDAEDKAALAKNAANAAKNIQLKWYKSDKNAIESLQTACSQLSEATTAMVDAQEKAFLSQKKLAEVSKFLLGLGLTNVASSRMVIRVLELRLKNASEEQIDELARQELENVVKQLKAQEDMQSRIEKHANALLEHDRCFVSTNETLKQHQKDISVLSDDIVSLRKDTEQYVYNITQALENFSKKIKDECKNIEEQRLLVQKQMKDCESQLEDSFKSLTAQNSDWLNSEMNDIKKVNHQYKVELEKDLLELKKDTSNNLTSIRHKIDSLSHNVKVLSKKTFLDTYAYKILIGLLALFSFVVSLFFLLGYNNL